MATGALAGIPIFGSLLYGLQQESEAKKGLAELAKIPYPKFASGESIFQRANNDAQGLTPQELSNEQQGYNRLANARYRMATDRNPSLSGVINAGIGYGSVQNTLGLAAMDASARRQSLHSLIGLYGSQSNLQTNNEIQNRVRQETAYGQAEQAGVQNIASTGQQITNIGLAYLTGGFGGGKQQGLTSPQQLGSNQIPSMGAINPPKTYTDWNNFLGINRGASQSPQADAQYDYSFYNPNYNQPPRI